MGFERAVGLAVGIALLIGHLAQGVLSLPADSVGAVRPLNRSVIIQSGVHDVRVALLFITRGPMPLEPVWTNFFQAAAELAKPVFSQADVDQILQLRIQEEVDTKLMAAGSYNASDVVRRQSCANDSTIREAAAELDASWRPRTALKAAPRGARLRHPAGPQHPAYAGQRLFSTYVHPAPEHPAYGPGSVFRSREIEPRVEAGRFMHALALAELLLLEAALVDAEVLNARFVMVSEVGAPVVHPAVLWLQMLSEQRNRLGLVATANFTETLHKISVMRAVSPWAFTAHFPADVFQSASQWAVLTYTAARVCVHDEVVEPWFATFGDRRMGRCEAKASTAAIRGAAVRVEARGEELRTKWNDTADDLLAQLRSAGLPPMRELSDLYEVAACDGVPAHQCKFSRHGPPHATAAQHAAIMQYVSVRPRELAQQWGKQLQPAAKARARRLLASATQLPPSQQQPQPPPLLPPPRASVPMSSGPGWQSPSPDARGSVATLQSAAQRSLSPTPFEPPGGARAGAEGNSTWELWPLQKRQRLERKLEKVFGWHDARALKVTSDENMIASQLSKYGMSGPAWQTRTLATFRSMDNTCGGGGHACRFNVTHLRARPKHMAQTFRGSACSPQSVRAAYASAAMLLDALQPRKVFAAGRDCDAADGAVPQAVAQSAFATANVTWHELKVRYAPMPEECHLLARKLNQSVTTFMDFFESCKYVGFSGRCLHCASSTMHYGSAWRPARRVQQAIDDAPGAVKASLVALSVCSVALVLLRALLHKQLSLRQVMRSAGAPVTGRVWVRVRPSVNVCTHRSGTLVERCD